MADEHNSRSRPGGGTEEIRPKGRNSAASGRVASRRPMQRDVLVTIDDRVLPGRLVVPPQARGVVVFAHGTGSSQRSPRNRYVAQRLQEAGFATLLMDLLTEEEESVDLRTATLRYNIDMLSKRLVAATWWLVAQPETTHLPVAFFGTSTGAAAALVGAAELANVVAAVVSRGGRPELAGASLERVLAPTLLIVAGLDAEALQSNQAAMLKLPAQKKLEIVPGASRLFEEPNALDMVAELARGWFAVYLPRAGARPRAA